MRIIFIRHGEPDYEHDCLTDRGRLQAAAAAERLREEGIEDLFSSPLGRAAETAAFTAEALNLPVRTLDWMRELHWGSVDGSPVPADGHPWDLADMLAAEGYDLTDPAWREHPYFKNNIVTAEADRPSRALSIASSFQTIQFFLSACRLISSSHFRSMSEREAILQIYV